MDVNLHIPLCGLCPDLVSETGQVSTLGKSVQQGAQTSICAALTGGGGAYLADCVPKDPHAAAHDAAAGKRLWTASAALLARAAPSAAKRLAL
jgi:hypothetical protein